MKTAEFTEIDSSSRRTSLVCAITMKSSSKLIWVLLSLFIHLIVPVHGEDSPVDIPPHWQRIGPYGQNMWQAAFCRNHPEMAFILSRDNHRPLYKSVNKGLTWERVSSDYVFDHSPYSMSVSPDDPDTILVTGYEISSGTVIYRTVDGGCTWTCQKEDGAKNILYDWNNGQIAYAYSVDAGERGNLSKSTDGGVTWKKISSLEIAKLFIDPHNSNHLLTIVRNHPADVGLYCSWDGGAEWIKIGFDDIYLHDAAFGQIPGTLYVLTTFREMFKSTDNGRNWTLVATFQTETNDLDVFYGTQEVIYIALGETSAIGDQKYYGIYRSEDCGQNWVLVPGTAKNIAYSVVNVNPNDEKNLFVSSFTYDSTYCGYLTTRDGGLNWELPPSIFTGLPMSRVAKSPYNKDLLIGESSGGWQVLRSLDEGGSWQYCNFQTSDNTITSLVEFAFSKVNANWVYAASGIGIFLSEDQGMNWRAVTPISSSLSSNVIKEDPVLEDVYIAGGPDGDLLRTTNGGNTWETVYANPEKYELIKDIEYSRTNSTVVYAVKWHTLTEEVTLIKSVDSGVTWENLAVVEGALRSWDLAIGGTESDVIYVATGQHLFKSIDQGKVWEWLDYSVWSCITSKVHGGWIWASGYDGFVSSSDLGKTWDHIRSPTIDNETVMENSRLYFLESESKIFIATRSDGIWIYPAGFQPSIMMGGSSYKYQGSEKAICFHAWVKDEAGPENIEKVEILVNGESAGLALHDDGTGGDMNSHDGLFTLEIPLNGDEAIDQYPYQLSVTGRQGFVSQPWPELTINDAGME